MDESIVSQITTCGNSLIDQMAARYAQENNINLVALWTDQRISWISLYKKYFQLLDSGDILLVCWFGDNSRIINMMGKAKRMKKEVVIIRGYLPGALGSFDI